MEAVLTVISKVAVMLILIVVGYLVTKKGMLTERGASEITTLLIQIVTPCLIVNSFLTSEDSLSPGELLLSVGTSALAIALSIGLSLLFFRKEPEGRKKVLRFAVSFSNAGFMGLPLVEGIVGSKGVMYGSFFIVVFNIFCWTYGYSMMSGGQKMSLKVLLFNPGDYRQLCGQGGFALLRLGFCGVQDGGPAAAGGPGAVCGVLAIHPPLPGAVCHQRYPGSLPGGR